MLFLRLKIKVDVVRGIRERKTTRSREIVQLVELQRERKVHNRMSKLVGVNDGEILRRMLGFARSSRKLRVDDAIGAERLDPRESERRWVPVQPNLTAFQREERISKTQLDHAGRNGLTA